MTEQLSNERLANNDDLLWQQLKTLPAFRALLRAVEARFFQQIDLPQPALDLGCGDGHFAQMAFDHPMQFGIDPWWGPLNKALESGAYELPLQAMGDRLPFPDHSFAGALSNSVLEHIPDVQAVLNEVGRVLRPGAPFVLTVPSHFFTEYLGGAAFFNRLGLEGLADQYRNFFNRISRHAHTDPPEIWTERLALAGFRIERWQYYFSREALHTLEIGHVQGVPSAITHALSGHWIIGPYKSNLKWTERWVRPYYEEEFPEQGAYIFFLARKVSDAPIAVSLPAAKPFSLAELDEGEAIELPKEKAVGAAPTLPIEEETEEFRESTARAEAVPTTTTADAADQATVESPGRIQVIRHRWPLLLAIALSFVAPLITGSGTGIRPFAAIAVWVAAIALALYALFAPQSADHVARFQITRATWITCVLLFLSALGIRIYDLAQHPFILNGTEASLGLDALGVIDGSFRNPFSTGWLTNPTLPLFLLAIPIKLLGPSVLSLRLISPFVGAITVVTTFLLGRRLYGRAVGLTAAVLLLGSYFHLHFSRLGLTNVWDALLVLLSLGLIAIAWQQKPASSRLTWLLAGIAVGFSAYLYTSSHLLPLMLFAVLLLALLFERTTWKRQWPNIVAMGMLSLIIILPQLIAYWGNPGVFMSRAIALGILDSQSGWLAREATLAGTSELRVFGQQLRSAALAFHATLDTGTSFGPGKPLLNLISGILAALGFFLALVRLRRIQYNILVIWVLTTIIFAGALLISPPNSHRYIVAAPAVNLLAAIGLVELMTALFKPSENDERSPSKSLPSHQRKSLLVIVSLIIAVLIALYDIGFYFGPYRYEHHFADRNTEIADAMAQYLNDLEGDWAVYFYGPPSMYVDFPTIPFLAPSYQKDRNLFDVVEPDAELPLIATPNYVFIYLPERYEEIAEAKSNFPGGQEKSLSGYYADPLFTVYEVRDWTGSQD